MNSRLALVTFTLLALAFTSISARTVDVDIALQDASSTYSVRRITNLQGGFVQIPNRYVRQNDWDYNWLPAIQLGAQYAAAQAVSDGYFSTSFARVDEILKYSLVSSDPSIPVNGWNEAAQYIFDIRIISSSSEIIRVQVVVLVNQKNSSYEVISFRYKNVQSRTNNSGDWSEIQVTRSLLRQEDFLFDLRHGANFVLTQGNANTDLFIPTSDFFKISKIHGVWKRRTSTGTEYWFDIELLAPLIQNLRVNFQLEYNQAKTALKLESWSIEEVEKIFYDALDPAM